MQLTKLTITTVFKMCRKIKNLINQFYNTSIETEDFVIEMLYLNADKIVIIKSLQKKQILSGCAASESGEWLTYIKNIIKNENLA